nr:MAG TPA: hypothetical protein [Caudoviricetes sp.]
MTCSCVQPLRFIKDLRSFTVIFFVIFKLLRVCFFVMSNYTFANV